MILNLSDLSGEPLQSQIRRQIRAKVLSGDLPPRTPLPSIRSLSRMQKVSVITVQRAYEALERDGLIHARRGKGYFVAPLERDEKSRMAVTRLRSRLEPVLRSALAEGLAADTVLQTVSEFLDKESDGQPDSRE